MTPDHRQETTECESSVAPKTQTSRLSFPAQRTDLTAATRVDPPHEVPFAVQESPAAEPVLAAMRLHEYGKDAAIIGKVVSEHPGLVTAKTSIGGMRLVDVPAGELLPRIC